MRQERLFKTITVVWTALAMVGCGGGDDSTGIEESREGDSGSQQSSAFGAGVYDLWSVGDKRLPILLRTWTDSNGTHTYSLRDGQMRLTRSGTGELWKCFLKVTKKGTTTLRTNIERLGVSI